jgi:hypothetical protein
MLAEHWNGTEWTIQTTPNPEGATGVELRGISCSSSSACTAVGNYHNNSSGTFTLAEYWNGTEWKIQTTPNPKETKWEELRGVSCTSSNACTAVGYYEEKGSGMGVTFAERAE